MKKYMWIIIAVIVVGGVWSMIGRYAARKSAEALVEGITGTDIKTAADGTATYTTDEGTVSTSNKLPDSWPSDAPKYPNATVTFSGSSNSTASSPDSGIGVTLATSDDINKVNEFYKTNLVKEGWEITSDASFNGTTTLAATKANRQFGVYISPTTETGKTGSTMVISISTDGSAE